MSECARWYEGDNGVMNPLILCCGGRSWSKWGIVNRTIYLLREIVGVFRVIHGAQRGADRMAGHVAAYYGLDVEVIHADWHKHGKAAGPIRNTAMLESKPDYVIAFWDGASRGTLDTIQKAVNVYRIPTIIVRELK
jgi:hypothetical protein